MIDRYLEYHEQVNLYNFVLGYKIESIKRYGYGRIK